MQTLDKLIKSNISETKMPEISVIEKPSDLKLKEYAKESAAKYCDKVRGLQKSKKYLSKCAECEKEANNSLDE